MFLATSINYSPLAWKKCKRIWPLGAILLLHVAFFWALQSSMIHQATQTIPKEILAHFITPERPTKPTPSKPQPTLPKTVPVVKKNITLPRPIPIAAPPPTETAISVPMAAQPPSQHEEPVAATPPAPAVATLAPPRTITSGVEYIQAPDVKYPPIAKRMGEEGKSIIRVLINESGRAESVELQKSSGSSHLDEAAKQAVMRALFKPYMENGKTIPVFAIVPINFQLSG